MIIIVYQTLLDTIFLPLVISFASCCLKLVADWDGFLGPVPFILLILRNCSQCDLGRHTHTFIGCVVNLCTCLISWSASKGAIGEAHLRFEESASHPGHQEGGLGAGPAAGGVHYHGRCADLPRLSLRVSWRLVRAPPPQVRKVSAREFRDFFSMYFVRVWPCGLKDSHLAKQNWSEALNPHQSAIEVLLCIWLRLNMLSNWALFRARAAQNVDI